MIERPTNAIPADQVEPREFKITPWGEFAGLDGVTRIANARTVTELPLFQRATGHEEVALDFEHETVPKTDKKGNVIKEKTDQEPIIVAGYGTIDVRPDDGIYIVMTWWTPQGLAAYKSGSYRDLSPTLRDDPETHEVIGIHSVALTRAGQIPGLTAYSATQATQHTPKNIMSEEQCKKLVSAVLDLIKKANPDASLTEDSNLDEIIAGLTGLVSPMNTDRQDPGPAESSKPAAPEQDGEQNLAELVKRVEAMSAELEDMKQKTMSSENDNLINDAIKDGKELPMSADDLRAMDTPLLRKLLNGLPPGMVPMSARSFATQGAGRHESQRLKEMRTNWGITK